MIKPGDYSIFRVKNSFRQVLLRNHVDGKNYDLIFEGVGTMNIRFTTPIERLEVVGETVEHDLDRLKKIALISTENVFTIDARKVLYQENDLGHDESSLPIDREQPMTDEDTLQLFEHLKSGGKPEDLDFITSGDKWEIIVSF